jgi:hypothetical protein
MYLNFSEHGLMSMERKNSTRDGWKKVESYYLASSRIILLSIKKMDKKASNLIL